MPSAWDDLRYLETEPTARTFLSECYEKAGLPHPDRLAYQHSTRFVYFWLQARTFYQAAADADLLIRPLLLFYGCVQMLKGCMLAADPAYPHNSRMLQHGVTTRKLRRSPYRLLEDEIRPQKEGLFAHAAALWKLPPLKPGYKAKDLFASLPELAHPYEKIVAPVDWVPVRCLDRTLLVFPQVGQGALGYSVDTLVGYLNRFAPDELRFRGEKEDGETGKRVWLQGNAAGLDKHCLFAVTPEEKLFFWNGPEQAIPLPPWAVHYLLLYLLGMLCRYETEWWGELVLTHSLAEALLVERFLTLHQETFPQLTVKLLQLANPRGHL
ncbi:hypothetical protein G3578_15370 [Brevibacillus sp. SYP-B805]|uniref:YaaC family protein n=1 Tax=Brevibacillus sp. SYP-B805 TaxID=1578199 RepID=UPI0013EE02FF|nr:YaaC family protein [Brevibacillus sp. SYP-B805]NGQ96541.1 hypothetical protein [Brevibacillus sp. SYP-B805]